MLDSDRLRPKISPLDVWRVGASILFLAFGGYFIVTFLLSLGREVHRTWTQLILGCLVLLYGVYRLWSGLRNWRRLTREPQDRVNVEPHDDDAKL
jgi:hypothetical protein